MKRKFFGGLALAVMVVFTALPVFAADFRGGESFSTRQGETVDDNLYAAGSNIMLEGSVDGDLLSAGGTILFAGRVRDDAMVAGGTLSLLGEVGGDLRAAGGDISLGGPVGGELVVAGGQISASSRSVTEKKVTLAGGMVSFEGEAKEKLVVYGGEVVIRGKVGGDIFVRADKITIGKEAVIGGNFNYESGEEATIEDGAAISGKVDFKQVEGWGKEGKEFAWGGFVVSWFLKLLSTLLVGLLLYFVFKKDTEEFVVKNIGHFGWDFLRGLTIMIVLPIGALISFITVIGSPLSVGGLLLWIFFMILSGALGGMILGSLIWKLFRHKKEKEHKITWQIVILGIGLMSLIKLIPYLGWVIFAVFFITAYGGLWRTLYSRLFEKK